MPQWKNKNEKKTFSNKKFSFFKKPIESVVSLKDKNIVFNPNPSKNKKTFMENKKIEDNTKKLDFHFELIDEVDNEISKIELEKPLKEFDSTFISRLEETIEFRDRIGRTAVTTELTPEDLTERNIYKGIPMSSKKINLTNNNFEKYLTSKENTNEKNFKETCQVNEKDYSGLFYSKGIKLRLKKNKNETKEETKNEEKTDNNKKTIEKENSQTKDDNKNEEKDIFIEIENLKESIEKRKKDLEEKEIEIKKFKNDMEEIDQRQKDLKNDLENEKKLLTQEEKELIKLEKTIQKIESKHAKEEEKQKRKEIDSLLKEEEKIIESKSTEDFDLEDTLDHQLKKLIPILDNLLGELPDEIIENFANSKDFELYEKVVNKYKSK